MVSGEIGAESPFLVTVAGDEKLNTLINHIRVLDQALENVITPEFAEKINQAFDINYVFNRHGDLIDAARTIDVIDEFGKPPVIAFTEETWSPELKNNTKFINSIDSAFEAIFNKQPPKLPTAEGSHDSRHSYWRERGLLERGSIIVSVDLNESASRLLNAVLNDEYNGKFISEVPTTEYMQDKSFEDMLETVKQQSLAINYSNAIRERVATLQISKMLAAVMSGSYEDLGLNTEYQKKLEAIISHSQRRDSGKLSICVSYGDAHCSMTMLFRKYGVDTKRYFAKQRVGKYKSIGDNTDAFANEYLVDAAPELLDKLAQYRLLQFILTSPLNENVRYGYISSEPDTKNRMILWNKIAKLARDPVLQSDLRGIYSKWVENPDYVFEILSKHGIHLKRITPTTHIAEEAAKSES